MTFRFRARKKSFSNQIFDIVMKQLTFYEIPKNHLFEKCFKQKQKNNKILKKWITSFL